METSDKIEKFREFFELYYKNKLFETTRSERGYLTVDWRDITEYDPDLADELLDRPEETLKCAELALETFELSDEGDVKVKVRLIKLTPGIKCDIGDIRSKLIGKLIRFDGHLLRKSKVLPRTTLCKFECAMCGNIITLPQIGEQMSEPSQCGCGRKGKFTLLDKSLVDVQSLVIQERQEELEGTQQPQSIHVLLTEDLVAPHKSKKTNPGANVIITGIVKEVPIILKTGGKSTSFDLIVDANNLEVKGESFDDMELTKEETEKVIHVSKTDPLKLMALAIAPTIYGHKTLKKAITLQLFGGVKKTLQDGREVRGDSHILIIGDPGSGKTALLKFLTKLAPKWQYVSGGGGTSGRGISAAVVKDEILKTWTLDAGAAVLANNGTLFFDELDKMVKEDRWALHEVMESQSFTIHKAGINATLMAKVNILAAANPKLGRFDPYDELQKQMDLEPTLINRFDLVFPFQDIPDEEKDAALSKHILMSHRKQLKIDVKSTKNPFMDVSFFKKYIAYSKKNVFPELSDAAEKSILKFYNDLRQKGRVEEGKSRSIPINPRYLEGMIRLTESTAKARLSKVATKEDADTAIAIIHHCLSQFGFDAETGTYDIDRIGGVASASKRDKFNMIKSIVKDLKEKFGNLVPVDDILFKAKEEGFEESEAEDLIEILRKSGDLYEPRRGFIDML